MANKIESDGTTSKITDQVILEKLITDPDAVPILFHPQKQKILKFLLEKEMTIIDLKKATNMNPGTIKRHLTDLVKKGLAKQARTEINKYSITMKYYRATAQQFIVMIKWPKKTD
ncbi:MAG: winged helix-turn-helix domain-containing protein [Candidatus Hermodarchaeota archaeon]